MMPTKRIWADTQSNGIRLNSSAYGQHMIATLIPMLQAIIDPTEAEVTISRIYDTVNGYPGLTGTGRCFDNNPMTKSGSFYSYTDGDYFIQPTDPGDAEWNGFLTTWPQTSRGTTVRNWVDSLSSTVRDEVGCFLIFHSEYDTQFTTQQGWADNDPRVLERAWRRWLTDSWTQIGKVPQQCPVLIAVPIPFASGANAGFEMVREAFERIVDDRTMNAHFVNEQTMDCLWDADSPGTYSSHATNADIQLLARRMAVGMAQVLGPLWAPASHRLFPYMGPKIGWAQRTSTTNIRCFICHEGGTDFTLPASPTLSWRCFYGGPGTLTKGTVDAPSEITISAVTKVDYRTIDVTLATPVTHAAALRICYGYGNTRLLPDGGIYDNRLTVAHTNRVIPPEITGGDRIAGALCRTPARGLPVSDDPPPIWAIGPALV